MILCCISQVFCQANGCVLMLPARITFSIGCKTDAVCLWNFGLNSIEFRWSASVPAISLTEPIDRYAKKFATNASAMPDLQLSSKLWSVIDLCLVASCTAWWKMTNARVNNLYSYYATANHQVSILKPVFDYLQWWALNYFDVLQLFWQMISSMMQQLYITVIIFITEYQYHGLHHHDTCIAKAKDHT